VRPLLPIAFLSLGLFSETLLAQSSGVHSNDLIRYINRAIETVRRTTDEEGFVAFDAFRKAVSDAATKEHDLGSAGAVDQLGAGAAITSSNRAVASRLLRAYFDERYSDRLAGDLSEMLRFRTLAPDTGTNWDAPEFVRQRKWLEAKTLSLGLEFKSFDGRVEEITLKGGDSVIAILTHSDVVDVEGQTWSSPPWEGRIVNRRVIGRGAMDNKGPIIPSLYALAAMRDTRWKFSSTIKLLISNGEETDWSEIAYYQERARMPRYTIGMDGTFPVTHGQKGVGLITFTSDSITSTAPASWRVLSLTGGSWPGTIPEAGTASLRSSLPLTRGRNELEQRASEWCAIHPPAKLRVFVSGDTLKLTAEGKGGHASIPQNGHNALGDLTAFLSTLDLEMDQWGALVAFVGTTVGTETDGRSLGIAHTDSVMGALTNNLGVIKDNNGKPTALLNPRVPRGITPTQIDSITKLRADGFNRQHGTRIKATSGVGKPHLVPAEGRFVSTLLATWEEVVGTRRPPHVTGGGLQSKLFPGGVDFGPAFTVEEDRSHASDEYMTIDELKTIGALTVVALCSLSVEE